jgi:predicted nucleic acid-binding protein
MSKPRIALDSCSILHLLMGTEEWKDALDRIYFDASTAKIEIVICEISIAEVVSLKTNADGEPITAEQSAEAIARFFRHSFLIRRGITSRESELAAKLISEHGIGSCDAMIAAAAILADAEALYTTDGCSNRRKAGKLLTVGELQIASGKKMQILSPLDYETQ